jgi:hypothetical protein
MRTAEARLAPVSEVSEMEMDMWRSMMETSTDTADESILCNCDVFLTFIKDSRMRWC